MKRITYRVLDGDDYEWDWSEDEYTAQSRALELNDNYPRRGEFHVVRDEEEA